MYQSGYECDQAFDGVWDDRKGWAHEPKRNGDAVLTLFLAEPSSVTTIGFYYNREDYQATEFEFELKVGDYWMAPKYMVLSRANGETYGSRVQLSQGSKEVQLKFDVVREVSAVRLSIKNTNGDDKNSILSEIFIQNIPDMSGCKTVGGMQRDRACVFPFTEWSGATHHACTTTFGLPPWCATRTNNDGSITSNQFSGFCDQSCEVEQFPTCYGWNSRLTRASYATDRNNPDRRKCVFPFKKDDKWHNECINNSVGIPECPTTITDDGTPVDMAYCGPECPGSKVADQCVEASDGEGKGKRCVFPFKWGGVTHKECRDDNKCATSVDQSNGAQVYDKQWGYCGVPNSCKSDECTTVGGSSAGEACTFPFKNPVTRELHWNCTTAPLEQRRGSSINFASAPWCATETDSGDNMVAGKWGFCSEKCGKERQNNCYIDDGLWMREMRRCIFPFIYREEKHTQCVTIDDTEMCPTAVDANGIASRANMKPCAGSEACKDPSAIRGKVITVGYRTVGAYLNNGTKDLEIDFQFETGTEDTKSSHWNVEASVSAGFSAYGASAALSVSAGGGEETASTSSAHQTHTLSYKAAPRTQCFLKQKVLISGPFVSRTFELILIEKDLDSLASEGTERKLSNEDLQNLKTRNHE